MMTIKHVTPNGEELVKQVKSITFIPASSKNVTSLADDSLFVHEDEIKAGDEITSGTVYVMNSEGKTVAVYHLNASPQKLDKLRKIGSVLA